MHNRVWKWKRLSYYCTCGCRWRRGARRCVDAPSRPACQSTGAFDWNAPTVLLKPDHLDDRVPWCRDYRAARPLLASHDADPTTMIRYRADALGARLLLTQVAVAPWLSVAVGGCTR
jgi:hypothetical protein